MKYDQTPLHPCHVVVCVICSACIGMKRAMSVFLDFLLNFPYECLGMQSMRLPPRYARGMKRAISVFLIFFVIFLQNVWVCKVCAYPPRHTRGMKRAISVFLIFFVISLQNVWVCKVCVYPPPDTPVVWKGFFLFFWFSSWFPFKMFGYVKYALTAHGMKSMHRYERLICALLLFSL